MPAPNKSNHSQPNWGGEQRLGDGQEIVERTLADGRKFRIVKNYFDEIFSDIQD